MSFAHYATDFDSNSDTNVLFGSLCFGLFGGVLSVIAWCLLSGIAPLRDDLKNLRRTQKWVFIAYDVILAFLAVYYFRHEFIFRGGVFALVLVAEICLFLLQLPNFVFVLAQSLSLGVALPAIVSLLYAVSYVVSQASSPASADLDSGKSSKSEDWPSDNIPIIQHG